MDLDNERGNILFIFFIYSASKTKCPSLIRRNASCQSCGMEKTTRVEGKEEEERTSTSTTAKISALTTTPEAAAAKAKIPACSTSPTHEW